MTLNEFNEYLRIVSKEVYCRMQSSRFKGDSPVHAEVFFELRCPEQEDNSEYNDE